MKKQSNKVASLAALIAEGGYIEHEPSALFDIPASPWDGYNRVEWARLATSPRTEDVLKSMRLFEAAQGHSTAGGGNYISPIRHGAVVTPQPHHRPRVKIIYNHGRPLFYHADIASDCVDKLMTVLKERLQ